MTANIAGPRSDDALKILDSRFERLDRLAWALAVLAKPEPQSDEELYRRIGGLEKWLEALNLPLRDKSGTPTMPPKGISVTGLDVRDFKYLRVDQVRAAVLADGLEWPGTPPCTSDAVELFKDATLADRETPQASAERCQPQGIPTACLQDAASSGARPRPYPEELPSAMEAAEYEAGWWEAEMDASIWWEMSSLPKEDAANLLCGLNPLNPDADYHEAAMPSGETWANQSRRLLGVFREIERASPGSRTLEQWIQVSRERSLARHPWIEQWLDVKGRTEQFIGPLPTTAPAEASQTAPIRTIKRKGDKWGDEELRQLLEAVILPGMNAVKLAAKYSVTPQRMRALLKTAREKFTENRSASSSGFPGVPGGTRRITGRRY